MCTRWTGNFHAASKHGSLPEFKRWIRWCFGWNQLIMWVVGIIKRNLACLCSHTHCVIRAHSIPRSTNHCLSWVQLIRAGQLEVLWQEMVLISMLPQIISDVMVSTIEQKCQSITSERWSPATINHESQPKITMVPPFSSLIPAPRAFSPYNMLKILKMQMRTLESPPVLSNSRLNLSLSYWLVRNLIFWHVSIFGRRI